MGKREEGRKRGMEGGCLRISVGMVSPKLKHVERIMKEEDVREKERADGWGNRRAAGVRYKAENQLGKCVS